MNETIKAKIKKAYMNKSSINVLTNKEIIQKEIEDSKKPLSNNNKNINQRNFYKENSQYYKNKNIKRYNLKKEEINQKRRELYKKRLNNNNVLLKEKRDYLLECQVFAKEHNGACLSKEHMNVFNKLKFKCDKGHIFEKSQYHILYRKQWCPKCASIKANEPRKLKWTTIEKIAKDNGGKVLSKVAEYINTNSKLKWECNIGHKWRASISSIKYGKTWCPLCCSGYKENLSRFIIETLTGLSFPSLTPSFLKNPKSKRFLQLDGYNEKNKIAFEYNGIQHYEKHDFFQQKTSLNSQQERDELKKELCRKNNIRLCIINNSLNDNQIKIYIKQWLINNKINIIQDVNLEDFKHYKFNKQEKFKKFIDSLGYKLMDSFKGVTTKVNIECDNGHIWNVQPRAVNNGNRCPYCSKKIKYTLKSISEESLKYDLKCLEKEYVNNTKQMSFLCLKCNKTCKRTSTQIMNRTTCNYCENK